MIPFDETFVRSRVSPERMDQLWAAGWRHFGPYFFRYAATIMQGELRTITPLRMALARFVLSRSQKRILKRNRDLQVILQPASVDEERQDLFLRHRERFVENVPDSLHTFLSREPATVPCVCEEICVRDGERLLAVSYLDHGRQATSAVYAIFEPTETKRSLGILTMLKAIERSRELGCRYYYPGYATREPSIYDYKKRFSGLEFFDWESWQPLEGD